MIDPYQPFGRLPAILHWSFRIGRPFGIELRVFGTALVVALYTLWQYARIPWIPFDAALALTGISVGGLYLVVFTHELGHAFAGRRFGVPTPLITLSALGGLAHMSEPAPSPRAEGWISLAGPATHLAWIALAWPLAQAFPTLPIGGVDLAVLPYLVRLNALMMAFNLLPCFPMDGGRIFRALLCRRMHPNHATLWACRLGVLGGIAFAAYGMSVAGFGGSILFFIGVNNVMVCMREMTILRYSEGPYSTSSADPWSRDPEGWRTGAWADEREERSRRPTLYRLAGRASPTVAEASAPAPKRDDADTATAPKDDETLDLLLERVIEVGLAGLTEEERATLHRISRDRKARR